MGWIEYLMADIITTIIHKKSGTYVSIRYLKRLMPIRKSNIS